MDNITDITLEVYSDLVNDASAYGYHTTLMAAAQRIAKLEYKERKEMRVDRIELESRVASIEIMLSAMLEHPQLRQMMVDGLAMLLKRHSGGSQETMNLIKALREKFGQVEGTGGFN